MCTAAGRAYSLLLILFLLAEGYYAETYYNRAPRLPLPHPGRPKSSTTSSIAAQSTTAARSNGLKASNTGRLLERVGGRVVESAPPGMTSLVFVFDRTGSMDDDLNQVRQGAKGIFETVMGQRKKFIYNYVLVLFHDPDVDPPFVTTDPDQFEAKLGSVNVERGGDCPEMTLSGIQRALEASLPGSYIYVFTDASSKDYHLEDRVLNLIQEKQSSVVFVMTGDCGDRNAPGYRVFERIAAASFGQVFHLEKSNVRSVLDHVRHSITQRKVHLLYETREQGQKHVSSVPVEAHFSELTISVSGERDDDDPLSVEIKDPQNSTLKKSSYDKGTIDLKSVKLIRIKEPHSGVWSVIVSSKKKHTLRIFGHGIIDFKYGFASRPTVHEKMLNPRPITKQPTYLMVNMSGLEPPGVVVEISLVDYTGRELFRNETRVLKDNPNVYYVGPFYPPEDFFFVRVNGEDDLNYEFIRIAPTAIAAVDATIPRAYMAETYTVTSYQPVNFTCYIESQAPFTVHWLHNGEVLEGPLFYERTDVSMWTLDMATPEHRGYYVCQVTSELGNTSAVTYLDSREPPPRVVASANESVLVHEVAYIHCKTQSREQARIQWTHNRNRVGNSAKFYVFNNGTLRVLDAKLTDSGFYVCRASTSGGTAEAIVHLQVMELPKARIHPKEVMVVSGKQFTLFCRASGWPQPKITWLLKGKPLGDMSKNGTSDSKFRISAGKDELAVFDARPSDMGIYECSAESRAGRHSDIAAVRMAIPPEVQITPREQTVKTGNSAAIDCRASAGIPPPNITWYKEGTAIFSYAGVVVGDGRLAFQAVTTPDNGTYVCKAENMAGVATKTAELTIGAEPQFRQSPGRIYAYIEDRTTLPCYVTAVPKASVLWLKDDKPLEGLVEGGRVWILPDNSLVINRTEVEDQGRYTCVAKNIYGERQKHISLLMTGLEAPELAEIPSNVQLLEGGELLLNCHVQRGSPKPKVVWMRDGRPVEEIPGAIEVHTDGSLLLSNGNELNAGLYSCMAISPVGKAFRNVTVQLISPPRFLREYTPDMTRRILLENSPMTLDCTSRGQPTPTVTWKKDGKQLPLNYTLIINGQQLYLDEVTEAHEGHYTCTVENQGGALGRDFTIALLRPPQGTTAASIPNVMHIKVQTPLSLKCPVKEDLLPKPENYSTKYRWTKEGVPLSKLGSRSSMVNSGREYYVPKAEPEDAGNYTCVAENRAGTVKAIFRVEIATYPTIEGPPFRLAEIASDRSFKIHCQTKGTPVPKILWHFNGRPWLDTPEAKQNGDHILLSPVKMSHAGDYNCTAKNWVGKAEAITQLRVLVPPIIHSLAVSAADTVEAGDRAKAVLEGKKLELECVVGGSPSPSVDWLKNGRLLGSDDLMIRSHTPSSSFPDLTHHYLRWATTSITEAGRYTCVAKNNASETQRDIYVPVLAYPSIVEPSDIESVNVLEGSNLQLNCTVQGHPKPKVTWRMPQISGNRSASFKQHRSGSTEYLLVRNITTKEAGIYRCEAKNQLGTDSTLFVVEVLSRPKEAEGRQAMLKVLEGKKAKLECKVEGNPPPDISWTHNGRAIEKMGGKQVRPSRIVFYRNSISIERVAMVDNGSYTCHANNSVGSLELPFSLVVHSPPHLDEAVAIDPWPSAIVKKDVVLKCPVVGNPPPSRRWLKDSVEISPDKTHYIVEGGNNLRIEGVQMDDAGAYSCHAKNEVGELRTDYWLSVHVPPTVIEGGQTMFDTVEGQSVTLSCPVKATPSANIDWFDRGFLPLQNPEGMKLSTAEPRTLTIFRPTRFHAGNYRCRATNEAGSREVDLSLRVLVPPNIDDRSNLVSTPLGLLGRDLRIDCPADGIPTPKISWKMENGKLMALPRSSTDEKYSLEQNNQTLVVRRVTNEDRGVYICKAENSAGRWEEKFSVEVIAPPRMKTREEQYIAKREGDPIVLTCPIQLDQPTASQGSKKRSDGLAITWWKDGLPLDSFYFDSDDEKPEDEEESTRPRLQFHIDSVHLHDSGSYKCVASNRAGESQARFRVDILSKPRIDDSYNEPISVVHGRSVALRCPAVGTPQPAIRWYRNGVELESLIAEEGNHSKLKYRILRESSREIKDDGQVLEITEAGVDDMGIWTCEAENPAGINELRIVLDVWVEPIAKLNVLEDGTKTRLVGTSITLQCNVSGNPLPVIQWQREGGEMIFPISNGTQISGPLLTIESLEVEDGGRYYCVAQNEVARTSDWIEIRVLGLPRINRDGVEQNPRVLAGRTLTLTCEAEGEPTPLTKWFVNGTELESRPGLIISKNASFVKIINASMADEGLYSCEASNAAGKDELVYRVEIFQLPTITKGNTTMQEVLVGDEAILACKATGEPPPLITWQRNGVRVETGMRYTLTGDSLRIGEVVLADSGIYVCMATNEAGSVQQAFSLEVMTPPIVESKTKKAITAPVGKEIVLKCSAKGHPPPQISWVVSAGGKERSKRIPIDALLKKDDDYSVEENESSLRLRNLTPLVGRNTVTCMAKNKVGEAVIDFAVNTVAAPLLAHKLGKEVKNESESKQVIAGSSVTLECGIDFNREEETQIQWRHNGNSLRHNSTQLKIPVAQLNNTGNYTCTVKNLAGSVTQHMALSVGVPPNITGAVEELMKVKMGELAQLRCEVAGVPLPTLTWLRENGTSLPPSEIATEGTNGGTKVKQTAILDDIQLERAGTYMCRAENWAGIVEKRVELQVQVPPEIQLEKSTLTVNFSSIATLFCNVTGNPTPAVSWLKMPDMKITGRAGKFRIEGTSLLIERVSKNDEGTYQCLASNEAGQAMGIRELLVTEPPPVVPTPTAMSQPSNKKGNAEDDFNVIWAECDESGHPISNTFVPARGDIPQAHDEYVHWATMGSLDDSVIAANGTNGTLILCLPADGHGPRGPRRIRPTILPAAATSGQKNKSQSRSKLTTSRNFTRTKPQPSFAFLLHCLLNSKVARRRVSWAIGGTVVNASDEGAHPMNNGSLVLLYSTPSLLPDISTVACTVGHTEGVVEAVGSFAIRTDLDQPPRAVIRPTRIYTYPQMDIIIDCKLKAGGPLTTRVRWSKNNLPIGGFTPDSTGGTADWKSHHLDLKVEIMANNSLLLRRVTNSDRGTYKCRAWNSKGRSWDDVDLITEDVPSQLMIELGSIGLGRTGGGQKTSNNSSGHIAADVLPEVNSNDVVLQLNAVNSALLNRSGGFSVSDASPSRGIYPTTLPLMGLMMMNLPPLGYDSRWESRRSPSLGRFNRTVQFLFDTGEKATVMQRVSGVIDSKLRLVVDMEGEIPEITRGQRARLKFDPLIGNLVEDVPGRVSGNGTSTLHFGGGTSIEFTWEEEIRYDPASKANVPRWLETGVAVRVLAVPKLERGGAESLSAIRLQTRLERVQLPQNH